LSCPTLYPTARWTTVRPSVVLGDGVLDRDDGITPAPAAQQLDRPFGFKFGRVGGEPVPATPVGTVRPRRRQRPDSAAGNEIAVFDRLDQSVERLGVRGEFRPPKELLCRIEAAIFRGTATPRQFGVSHTVIDQLDGGDPRRQRRFLRKAVIGVEANPANRLKNREIMTRRLTPVYS